MTRNRNRDQSDVLAPTRLATRKAGLQPATLTNTSLAAAGDEVLSLIEELYPLNRSITGPGLRATIEILGRFLFPLHVVEVETGTQVFDWTVPREWSVSEAFIEHQSGRRIVDLRDSTLHVMSYSAPVDTTLTLEELRPYLHTLPNHPDWIPFRSSYHEETWGFCIADRVARAMPPGNYRVVIRSQLYPGSMTLAEYVHPGRTEDEVLVFAHTCHPSLCNDNLSGIAIAAYLASYLRGRETRLTYRFVFAPATIGSIAWLALNETRLPRIRHGLVLAMLGDAQPLRYQLTRDGAAPIDAAVRHVLRSQYSDAEILRFSPWGFDERQFATPGINLPVGRLTRALPGQCAWEHTSADNLDVITPQALAESWRACLRIFDVLERDSRFINLQPKGEPQLGRRGLYRAMGGHYQDVPHRQLALLWVLNQSDGRTTLLDIADRAGLAFDLVAEAAAELEAVGLLAPANAV